MRNRNYDNYLIIGLGLILLFFLSMNSWLYTVNESADINSFMTTANVWANEGIPYRDAYEQKGPIIYFIYLLAIKSGLWFRAIWLLEVLTMSISVVYLSKSFKLLHLSRFTQNMSLITYLVAMTATKMFDKGGGVEELTLPFVIYMLYLFIKQSQQMDIKTYEQVIAAIGFTLMFWIKYTMALSYVILTVAYYGYCAYQRKYKEILKNIGINVLVFGIISGVIVGYFAYHGVASDLFKVYFYDNIVLYNTSPGVGLRPLLIKINQLSDSFIFIITLMLATALPANRKTLNTPCMVLLIVLIVANYMMFHLWYYALIILPIGTILFASVEPKRITQILVFFIIVGGSACHLNQLSHTRFSNWQSNGQRIAKLTHQSTDIVQLGMLDTGVYNVTKGTPPIVHFQMNNIDPLRLPPLVDEPVGMLKNKRVKYAVINNKPNTAIPMYKLKYKGYHEIGRIKTTSAGDQPAQYIVLKRN